MSDFHEVLSVFSVLIEEMLKKYRSNQRAVRQKSCSTVGILLGKLIKFLCVAGEMKYICWETFSKLFVKWALSPQSSKTFFRTLDNL